MMKEVEAGNVEYLCIKDMSRMGRDYLKVGQIIDVYKRQVVEHAGGKEHRAAGGIDFGKPRRIIQIAGDIFLPLSGGQQLIAHGDDIGKVQIVNVTAAVVAVSYTHLQDLLVTHERE